MSDSVIETTDHQQASRDDLVIKATVTLSLYGNIQVNDLHHG